ncbi:MAG: hypothetical protein J0H54_01425 [Rhizobiales bacterium]|nr:hypothetical protein [Hyphomicrobiales bacterium]
MTLPPIFNADRRKAAIAKAAEAMADWRQSPFEFEGAAVAGIRAALCLAGYDWSRSDQEAQAVVAGALSRIGARRPSWEEGQRAYVEPRENCRWCGTGLPEEDQRWGFCCHEHAKLALQEWGFEARRNSEERYVRVMNAAQAMLQPKKACETCGKTFRSRDPRARFCSTNCANADLTVKRHTLTCEACLSPFESATDHNRFCSHQCRSRFVAIDSGRWQPKKLSPLVFVYHFCRAA